jgi:hypothetical protein
LVAFIVILILLLLIGGGLTAAYLLFFRDGGFPVNLPGKNSIVGSWYGLEDGQELYLKFQGDGMLHLASPTEGYWTTVQYIITERPGANGKVTYLEFYEAYDEAWETVAIVELKGNKLILTDHDAYDYEDDLIMEFEKISDKRFEDVKSLLVFEEWY